MAAPVRYVRRETAVSVAINGALSAGITWLVLGGLGAIPLWGFGNFVLDFVPQSFMIGLMGALVPGLLARRAAGGGGATGAIVARALTFGIFAAAAGTTLAAGIATLGGAGTIGFAAALVIKIVYGCLLALIVTPRAVRAAWNAASQGGEGLLR